jgi:hypothetical protein
MAVRDMFWPLRTLSRVNGRLIRRAWSGLRRGRGRSGSACGGRARGRPTIPTAESRLVARVRRYGLLAGQLRRRADNVRLHGTGNSQDKPARWSSTVRSCAGSDSGHGGNHEGISARITASGRPLTRSAAGYRDCTEIAVPNNDVCGPARPRRSARPCRAPVDQGLAVLALRRRIVDHPQLT